MNEIKYIGNELELFEKAYNWKRYVATFIQPHLEDTVLEVGAGFGGTTEILCDGHQREWISLEPDKDLSQLIQFKIDMNRIPKNCKVITGTIEDIPDSDFFNTIVYIDVIEHIENDIIELESASKHLKQGGNLIVLAPAHHYLYSPFDRAIGHFRRYDKQSFRKISIDNVILEKVLYLDSIGLLLSLGNKILLKQSNPTKQQIVFWDKIVIPLSKFFDRSFNYTIGKSVLGIWKRI